MARLSSKQDPLLNISAFFSGYYTNRSQLFAPFRPIGVNVVSFHDSLIDGSNMEVSDQFEIVRRPGYSKFCSVALSSTEVVNQFYSNRSLDGTVSSLIDTTERVASFTPISIDTIFTKTVGAGQGFPLTIGNLTYFSDGVGADMQKWESATSFTTINPSTWGLAAPTTMPTISGSGFWQPNLPVTEFQSLLDQNGAIEVANAPNGGYAISTKNFTSWSSIPLAGSVGGAWSIPGVPTNPTDWTVPNPINANQHTNFLAITGFGFAIPSNATILGVQFTVYKFTSNIVVDNSVKLVISGTPSGTEHALAGAWPQRHSAIFPYGQAVYGNGTDTWGVALTPAIVNSASFGMVISAAGTSLSSSAQPNVNYQPYPPQATVYYSLPASSGTTGNTQPVFSTTLGATVNDGSVSWTNFGPILTWYPLTNYVLPAVILDSNNNLQLATQVANIVNPWLSSPNYTVGQVVFFGGQYWVAAQNNTNTPPSTTGSFVAYTTVGGVTTQTTSQPYWIPTPNPNATGSVAPTWNTVRGGFTSDGSYEWVNCGSGYGLAYTNYSYVYGYRTIYGHLTTSSPFSVNTGAILGPAPAPITSFSITSSVVTFQGKNNFVVGDTFTVSGLTFGTYLNGLSYVVLASGLSPTQFEAAVAASNVASTNDSGVTTALIATVKGVGTLSPLCNATATITNVGVVNNIVTIIAANNFVPGLQVTFSNLSGASFLNGIQAQIISVSAPGQPVGTPPTQFQVLNTNPLYENYAPANDSGTATFNAIEVYRISDGGGYYLFAGAVTNPGSASVWTLNDFVVDDNLDALLTAPLFNLNDPPPGAPGSTVTQAGTVTAYWQGRIWMAVGNFVYFDAGPDCTNGVPEESWPPANAFQFSGPVWALAPTSEGLLVYLDDRVDIILGGPETISFYAKDLLKNFGVSSFNAVFQDSDVNYVLTTQGQFYVVEPAGKAEEGLFVANYLMANFPATDANVTFHRMGEDVGVFLSNGTDTILRRGTNPAAWSLPAKPVGGVGALNSIETRPGTYSLMMAPATAGAGHYLLARDLTTWQDNGSSYACSVTIGTITLSELGGEAVAVNSIVGYFKAVGTEPTVSILPNEINASTSFGFIELPDFTNEPPVGQTYSTSLWSLRWPVNAMNSDLASQFVHHLQVKIDFEAENVPSTLTSLALKERL